MEPGLVSIMMPAYNAGQYIDQAIQSVLEQSYHSWELVIVDDGSTDNTVEIITQFNDPRIKVFGQVNAGEATARNAALKVMRGEFVAFLDADDIYLPDHLVKTLEFLQTHPEYDGVYTDGYYCDENGNHIQRLSSRRRGPFEGRLFEEIVRASDVFGPPLCVVLRIEIITRYNLAFDKDIVIGPDWDFFIRYTDLAQFGYINECTCKYRVHQTNITVSIDIQKRAVDLTRCRTKAIKMESFNACSDQTRSAVFYDLLINLLDCHPEHQSDVARWSEFAYLPRNQQARLLRLMASNAIIEDCSHDHVSGWIKRSRELNPADWRGAVISSLYRISPNTLRQLLHARSTNKNEASFASPFADIEFPESHA